METIINIILLLALAAFMVLLFVYIPMQMAKARNRNPYFWVAISIIFSPLIAVFLLWVSGPQERI